MLTNNSRLQKLRIRLGRSSTIEIKYVSSSFVFPGFRHHMKYRVSSPLTNSGWPVSVYHRRVKVRSFYVKHWMLYIAAQCTAESINPKWVSKYHSIPTVTDKIRRERERENHFSRASTNTHKSYTKCRLI